MQFPDPATSIPTTALPNFHPSPQYLSPPLTSGLANIPSGASLHLCADRNISLSNDNMATLQASQLPKISTQLYRQLSYNPNQSLSHSPDFTQDNRSRFISTVIDPSLPSHRPNYLPIPHYRPPGLQTGGQYAPVSRHTPVVDSGEYPPRDNVAASQRRSWDPTGASEHRQAFVISHSAQLAEPVESPTSALSQSMPYARRVERKNTSEGPSLGMDRVHGMAGPVLHLQGPSNVDPLGTESGTPLQKHREFPIQREGSDGKRTFHEMKEEWNSRGSSPYDGSSMWNGSGSPVTDGCLKNEGTIGHHPSDGRIPKRQAIGNEAPIALPVPSHPISVPSLMNAISPNEAGITSAATTELGASPSTESNRPSSHQQQLHVQAVREYHQDEVDDCVENRSDGPDSEPLVTPSPIGEYADFGGSTASPYTCAHCAEAFSTADGRKQHIRNAHGKRFSCDACKARFTRRHDLDKHYKIVHLKERRFACEYCPMTFGQKHHLVRHTRSLHLKLRDFGCNLCPARFSREEHLYNHTRAVHGLWRPYFCIMCEFKFPDKKGLKSHIKEAHNVKAERISTFAGWQPDSRAPSPKVGDLLQMWRISRWVLC